MGRRSEAYTVIDSKPPYWYYKLAGWSRYKSTGIRIRTTRSGKPTNRREAEEFAREEWERHKIGRGGVQPTLREMLEPYFDYDRCPHVARVLADNKHYSRDHAASQRKRVEMYVLTDPVADEDAIEVTPGDIEDWKQRLLSRKVGARTINMTLSAVQTAYREEIHRDPARFRYDPTASVSAVSHQSDERGIYTLEELRRMFGSPEPWGYTKQHKGTAGVELSTLQAYAFALAFFQLGERPSALLRLDWGDVSEGTVTFSQTKTHRPRTVPLPAQLSDALEELREDAVRIGPSDPVFGYEDGRRRGYTWFSKRWRHMMKALKLPENDSDGCKRTPYSLKHSLITHLIDAGEDEILVREWVGHAHTHGEHRVLTAAQSRYKRRQTQRLAQLRPSIERLLEAQG